MREPRSRRIVKRALAAQAIVVLLLACYLGSWGAVNFAFGPVGLIQLQNQSRFVRKCVFWYTLPPWEYSRSDLPGSKLIGRFGLWCLYGDDVPEHASAPYE